MLAKKGDFAIIFQFVKRLNTDGLNDWLLISGSGNMIYICKALGQTGEHYGLKKWVCKQSLDSGLGLEMEEWEAS